MNLSIYTINQLKEIIRNYNEKHQIKKYSKLNRDDLDNIMRKFLKLVNGKFYGISKEVNFPKEKIIKPKKQRIIKPKKERIIKPKKEPVVKPKKELVVKPIEHKNKLKLEELSLFRERIYKIMFKILNSPSKRSRQILNKELGLSKDDYSIIVSILDNNKSLDFIPTPPEAIKPFIDTVIERNDKFVLEPSCGLGIVIHYLLKAKPDINITAYEINSNFYNLLLQLFPKEFYPNITFHKKDFLESNENGSFSNIFCNPPFTYGHDSRFYINFLFECSRISKQSKTEFHDNLIYFISPQLYPTQKDYIDTSLICTSSYMNKKRVEDILKIQISNTEFNDFKKGKESDEIYNKLEDILPNQIRELQKIKFEAGTKITAYIYECINI